MAANINTYEINVSTNLNAANTKFDQSQWRLRAGFEANWNSKRVRKVTIPSYAIPRARRRKNDQVRSRGERGIQELKRT
ncbi:hypothetical protein HK102_013686, partial [Quaeritorhiza haematococci]